VIGSSVHDWNLLETTIPFSLTLAFHGISASLVGKYQMKIGARASVGLSSLFFGGGLIVGSLGIWTHSLPLLYLGYGVMAGTGIGIGYTPPI